MSVTFDNTTFSTNQSAGGTVLGNNFTGTSALSGTAPVTINGTIDQPGSVVALTLNTVGSTSSVSAVGTYLGYSAADADGNFVYYFSVTDNDLTTPADIAVTSAPTLPLLTVATAINTSPATAPVCFVSGTRIRTIRGEIMVETLKVGDEVVTASGEHRPIVWIGHRDMDLASHKDAQPVRICASAVAPGVPVRDLLVSPGHRLFIDDVLVRASDLVNGTSIRREQTAKVTYWHIELESHDILIAEGMPSESYAEAANRTALENGEVVFGKRPQASLILSKPLCAPLLTAGPQLDAMAARLRARGRKVGTPDAHDPSIQIVADGVVLTPVAVNDWQFDYVVPESAGSLVLNSRTAVPQMTQAGSSDARTLGVCVRSLAVDGKAVSLDDPRLGFGWNEPEDNGAFRWTKGDADLPVGRDLTIRITPLPVYANASADDGLERMVELKLAA